MTKERMQQPDNFQRKVMNELSEFAVVGRDLWGPDQCLDHVDSLFSNYFPATYRHMDVLSLDLNSDVYLGVARFHDLSYQYKTYGIKAVISISPTEDRREEAIKKDETGLVKMSLSVRYDQDSGLDTLVWNVENMEPHLQAQRFSDLSGLPELQGTDELKNVLKGMVNASEVAGSGYFSKNRPPAEEELALIQGIIEQKLLEQRSSGRQQESRNGVSARRLIGEIIEALLDLL